LGALCTPSWKQVAHCQTPGTQMSQEAFYYQVQMQEEYEMRMKEFAEELREEMMNDSAFCELTEENQNKLIAEEMKIYEESTK
jgi:hypothetical protein